MTNQSLTEKYLKAFEAAGEGRGKLEDLLDKEGLEAVRKIIKLAGQLPNDAVSLPKDHIPNLPTDNLPVPSVTRTGDDGRTNGYDLFSLLLEDRIVMLLGEVNPAMSSIACASLLYLDNKDPTANINVYINSPGGSVLDGNAIIDTMESVHSKIIGTGFGFQASMGSHLLAACDERYMTQSSKLLIHSIASGTEGNLADQVISIDMTERLFEEGKANYIKHIGLTPEFWDLCSVKNSVFSADQAVEMGFIHAVVGRNADKKPSPYGKSAEQYLFNQAARRKSQLPKTEAKLKDLLQATSADGSKGERLRPEILVALSQMPKYWVEEKQRAFAAEHNIDLSRVKVNPHDEDSSLQTEIAKVLDKHIAAKKAANDNGGTSASVAKKASSGPK